MIEEVILHSLKFKIPIMDWREYITVDPNVCHGKFCIKGIRVSL